MRWCFLGIHPFLSVIFSYFRRCYPNVIIFLSFQEMLSALGPNTDFERMVEHCLERISRQCTQFLLKTENKMKWIPLLWNMIYFTEHISKMVHICNNWRKHTTQLVYLYKKDNLMNTRGGGNGMKIEQVSVRIKFPGLWELILLQVTKRHNVKQKCAVKLWFAIHLLYSGKYNKGDVTYIVQNGRLHLVSKTYDTYGSTFPKIIWLGIWFNL